MAQISIFPTEEHPGRCCNQPSTRLVIYKKLDDTPADAYLVCEYHWKEADPDGRKPWQDDAVKITELVPQ